MIGSEFVFDAKGVTVVRLPCRPVLAADRNHRQLVAYIGPGVDGAELVRLLRDTAEKLARTLPRDAQ